MTTMDEKRALLARLPVPQDSYDDYFRCIAAVHRAGFSPEEVEAWAATGDKYVPGEWISMRAGGIDNYSGNPVTEATFYWFCLQAGVLTSGGNGIRPIIKADDYSAPWHFRPVTSEELQNLPQPSWLVQDILPQDTLAMLAGPPKAGKSALVTAWALSQGSSWLDRRVNLARWLHFTEETPRSILNRYRAAGHDLTYTTDATRMLACVRTYRQPWSFQGFLNEVGERLLVSDTETDVRNFDVVVLDTLLFWLEISDANDASTVTSNLRAVQQLKDYLPGKTLLLVHQTGKGANDENPGSAILGSTAFRATFGVNLVLTRQQQNLSLHVEGRDVEDEYRIDYRRLKEDGRIVWKQRSDADDILAILEDDIDNQLSVKDIGSRLETPISDNTIRKSLQHLVDLDKVKRSKDGRAFVWQARGI